MRSILLVAVLVLCVQNSYCQEQKILDAAKGRLSHFLSLIPPGHEDDFGFSPKEKLRNCGLARPYRIMTFSKDFSNLHVVHDSSYLVEFDQWLVPIMYRKDYRVLLTILKPNNTFLATDMGGATIAEELQKKSKGMRKREKRYLLRIFALSADFVVRNADSSFFDAEYIPLASARLAMPGLNKPVKVHYTLREVQKYTREALLKINH